MITARPMPPADISDSFCAAPEIFEFIQHSFFSADSALYNADHDHLHHLAWPNLAFLWSDVEVTKKTKRIVGECEKFMVRAGGWQKARQEAQMEQWFSRVPTFIITLDAGYCRECSDMEFCALIEHELYHIAHAKDFMGNPAYNRDTGNPKLAITAHDVEEFVGVVRRYGMSPDVERLVKAANAGAVLSRATVAHSCGTCSLRVA